jgi:hypothetical protein
MVLACCGVAVWERMGRVPLSNRPIHYAAAEVARSYRGSGGNWQHGSGSMVMGVRRQVPGGRRNRGPAVLLLMGQLCGARQERSPAAGRDLASVTAGETSANCGWPGRSGAQYLLQSPIPRDFLGTRVTSARMAAPPPSEAAGATDVHIAQNSRGNFHRAAGIAEDNFVENSGGKLSICMLLGSRPGGLKINKRAVGTIPDYNSLNEEVVSWLVPVLVFLVPSLIRSRRLDRF